MRRLLKTGDSTRSSPLASDDSQAPPRNGETEGGQDSWKGHDEGSDGKRGAESEYGEGVIRTRSYDEKER